MKKIIIAGGTGSLGKVLTRHFAGSGYEVTILSRKKIPTRENVKYIMWDGKNPGEWTKELEDAEAIINLTGKSVNCRYTDENKKEIISSRVNSTSAIGNAINQCTNPPKVWINASSAAIYGDTEDRVVDERSPYGEGFSPEVCKKWEYAFYQVKTPLTRKIALRIGLVLTIDGGVLDPLFNLAKYWLVGTIGSGKQYMTWIHETDFVNLVNLFLNDTGFSGSINIASPDPVTNKEFMFAIRKAYGVPVNLPAPSLFVRMGAFLMGTEGELVLKGRRVISVILKEKGFGFKYPFIQEAMTDIIRRKKKEAGN